MHMPLPTRHIITLLAVLLPGFLTGCATDTVGSGGPVAIGRALEANARNRYLPTAYAAFDEDRIQVAILLPLSGPSREAGAALLDAAGLALFQAYDPRISLVPYDTLGTPEGAALAARRALNDGADIFLGPLFAASIESIRPIAGAEDITVIGFSNDRSVAGDNVYLLSFMPGDEVRRVIRHAAAEGYERFAALIPDSDYGNRVLRAFSDEVRHTGGSIAALEVYPRDPEEVFLPVRRLADYDTRRRAFLREEAFLRGLDDDLAEELLERLENLETLGEPPFDAVLVPEGGQLLRSLVPLLPFFEVDPSKIRFLGTGLWDDRSLIHEPPLKGGWYASAPSESADEFLAGFEDLFGYAPPRIATLAYDAMSLVAHLARNEIRAERFGVRALEDPNGFTGIDGPFRFLASGLAERRLAIIEIQPNGFRTISPAPESFQSVSRTSSRDRDSSTQ